MTFHEIPCSSWNQFRFRTQIVLISKLFLMGESFNWISLYFVYKSQSSGWHNKFTTHLKASLLVAKPCSVFHTPAKNMTSEFPDVKFSPRNSQLGPFWKVLVLFFKEMTGNSEVTVTKAPPILKSEQKDPLKPPNPFKLIGMSMTTGEFFFSNGNNVILSHDLFVLD